MKYTKRNTILQKGFLDMKGYALRDKKSNNLLVFIENGDKLDFKTSYFNYGDNWHRALARYVNWRNK